jgi:hypothetical protein
MATFTVHHRDRAAAAILADADRLEFVREGFSWTAAILPLVWFAAHGLWLVLMAYVAAVVAMSYAGALAGASGFTTFAVGLGVHVLAGFEAYNLRRWTLRRRGLGEVAVVSGSSLHDAELRFFRSLVADAGETASAAEPQRRATVPPLPLAGASAATFAANPAAIFPEPGGTR